MTGRALYFTGRREVDVRPVSVEGPDAGELAVDTSVSAISTGTELLVYRDEVPSGMDVDTALDAYDGEFAYPLRYGYAAVGQVTEVGAGVDREWIGRRVFAFAQHQSRFTVDVTDVVTLPPELSDGHASLLPTVETAVNLTLDAQPAVGERAVVFGAGPVGLATTDLLARFPLDELVVVEPVATRREIARSLGADAVVDPNADAGVDAGSITEWFDDRDPRGADLAIELSGKPDTLDDAVATVGYGGRVLVGSWYGTRRAAVGLGGSFHRDDVTIRSSQVSRIAPERRGRWSSDRRLGTALDRLREFDAGTLISDRVPLERAPDVYRRLDRDRAETVQVLFTYD